MSNPNSKRVSYPFSPRRGVSDLYASFIDAKPLNIDWNNVFIEDEFPDVCDSSRCEDCGAVLVGTPGEYQHCDLDPDSACEGYVVLDAPMMNYGYPVSFERVGDIDDAARLLVDLPLCCVTMRDPNTGEDARYLALTGGGMDLSQDICIAYMRMGYLPPTHFARLPQFSGERLTSVNRWLYAGMRRSLSIARRRLVMDAGDLKRWRANLIPTRLTAQPE